MKSILYILFLSSTVSLSAQQVDQQSKLLTEPAFELRLTGESFTAPTGYMGKQYFKHEWFEGRILLTNGELVANKQLQYSGLVDELIWRNSANQRTFKLDKFSVDEFWLEERKDSSYHFKRINTVESRTGFPTDIFAEVALEGRFSLYIYRRINVTDIVIRKDKEADFYFKRIEPQPEYYLKQPSGKYVSVKKANQSSFLQLFPDEKKDIRKLLRENDLYISNEQDLIGAIELLNKKLK